MLGLSLCLSFYKRQAVYTEIKLPLNLYTTAHSQDSNLLTKPRALLCVQTYLRGLRIHVHVYKGLYILFLKNIYCITYYTSIIAELVLLVNYYVAILKCTGLSLSRSLTLGESLPCFLIDATEERSVGISGSRLADDTQYTSIW